MLDYSFNIFSSCKKYFCFRFPDQPYFLPLTLAFFIEEKEHTPKWLKFPDHIIYLQLILSRSMPEQFIQRLINLFPLMLKRPAITYTSKDYMRYWYWLDNSFDGLLQNMSSVLIENPRLPPLQQKLKGSYEKMTILFITNWKQLNELICFL